MAEAGSVAPVFRDGGYDATTTYDFYHAIIYNNKLYFCRQDGTIGHEPQEESDEYWFLSIDGNIVDASTLNGKTESELSVANSEQLGGKGASEYALESKTTRHFKLGISNNTAKYTMFARCSNTITGAANGVTLFIAGTEDIASNMSGAYIVQLSGRQGVARMNVKAIRTSANASYRPKFGYYEDATNGLFYFGMYAPTWTNYREITVLEHVTEMFRVENFGDSTTAPDGWTTVEPEVLATTTDLANYLSTTGGIVEDENNAWSPNVPLFIRTSRNATTNKTWAFLGFKDAGYSNLGYFGFTAADTPVVRSSLGVNYEIHHDGNSAKVVQATSAPSDTTAVWVDTANKVSKIYKDGAWTALT